MKKKPLEYERLYSHLRLRPQKEEIVSKSINTISKTTQRVLSIEIYSPLLDSVYVINLFCDIKNNGYYCYYCLTSN